jgi:hypothetical protein
MGGWKDWQIGEVVTESDFQGFVQDQVVQVYPNAAARGSALGENVTDGMVAYMQDGRQLATYGTASGWSGVPLSPNYIINGAFDFWQRGTSFASVGFGPDRWNNISGSNTATMSRATATPAEVNLFGFGDAQFFLSYVKTSVISELSLFETRIEDVRALSGQTATLSYWARVSSGTAENAPNFVQNFGSGGSSAVVTTADNVTLTTSWQRFSHTITIPSVSGKTIGASSYLAVRPLRHLTSSAATYFFTGVQLEAGSVATPFRRNANSIQGELAACQRYFQVVADGAESASERFVLAYMESNTEMRSQFRYTLPMRVAPTFSATSGTNFYSFDRAGSSDTLNSLTGVAATTRGIEINNTTDMSGTTGQVGRLRLANAGAVITLSAEL